MLESKRNQIRERKLQRIGFFALVAVVALSNAIRDLGQFQAFAADVERAVSSLGILPTANARTPLVGEKCSVTPFTQTMSDDFRWHGGIAPGKAIEIKGINGAIIAEPSAGGEVEVVASKTARRGDLSAVRIEVLEHPEGVTICAVYPSDDPDRINTCEPGSGPGRNRTSTTGTRSKDVRVDFGVRVPLGVAFIGRTVNGVVSATSLSGNVISQTVNGSIRISTTGYAEASTVNGGIKAKLGNANWPHSVGFTTVNGGITVELPADLSAAVSAETLNGEVSSDFPVSVIGVISRRRLSGTIGYGGRELILKTLNGSISLRQIR